MVKLVFLNWDVYDYLVELIFVWFDQFYLVDMMVEVGWQVIVWCNVCGGVVVLYCGWKGSDEKEMV